MRGQKKYSAGTIVDLDGIPKFYIVPNKLILFGIASMALVILITAVLSMMVIYNKFEIEDLREKIKVQETGTNDTDTPNTH